MTTTTKPSFVYVTYIAASQEKVWRALVDPEVMREYWNGPTANSRAHVNVSDWKPGSRWEHQREDEAHTVDIVGTVVENNPLHRLVLTWARPKEADDTSKQSRVSFDLEPHGDGFTRLTVTHEDLENDVPMLTGISNGWPHILSNLKTLLETGRALTPRYSPV